MCNYLIQTCEYQTLPDFLSLSFSLLEQIVFSYSLYSYRPPKYGDYIYPEWATAIGWMISLASIIPIPVIFIWTVYTTEGATIREVCSSSIQIHFNTHSAWRRTARSASSKHCNPKLVFQEISSSCGEHVSQCLVISTVGLAILAKS